MRFRLVPTLGALLAMATMVPPASTARPRGGPQRALVFDAGLPLAQKRGDTYEGLAVDVLNAIKEEAGATSLTFSSAEDVEDGLQAIVSLPRFAGQSDNGHH